MTMIIKFLTLAVLIPINFRVLNSWQMAGAEDLIPYRFSSPGCWEWGPWW